MAARRTCACCLLLPRYTAMPDSTLQSSRKPGVADVTGLAPLNEARRKKQACPERQQACSCLLALDLLNQTVAQGRCASLCCCARGLLTALRRTRCPAVQWWSLLHCCMSALISLVVMCQDVIRALLHADPAQRLSAVAVLRHPWMQSHALPPRSAPSDSQVPHVPQDSSILNAAHELMGRNFMVCPWAELQ